MLDARRTDSARSYWYIKWRSVLPGFVGDHQRSAIRHTTTLRKSALVPKVRSQLGYFQGVHGDLETCCSGSLDYLDGFKCSSAQAATAEALRDAPKPSKAESGPVGKDTPESPVTDSPLVLISSSFVCSCNCWLSSSLLFILCEHNLDFERGLPGL